MNVNYRDRRASSLLKVLEPFETAGGIVSELFDALLPRNWATYGGLPFERVIQQALLAFDFNAQLTNASGDGGVDIILKDQQGHFAVVQCKCYAESGSIGAGAVRELIGAKLLAKADSAILISTCPLTPQADVHAKDADVSVLSGTGVNEFLQLAEKRLHGSAKSSSWPTISQLTAMLALLNNNQPTRGLADEPTQPGSP